MVVVRLADDTRARVPFALVGVLLLVGSATLSATIVSRPPPTVDRDADEAVERAVASSRTALRDAVQRAGRDAAARPVVEPANTSTGRVLNASAPFRDYLRLRIYVAARRELRTVATRVGDARASVTLSPTPNASALRRAKRDVTVEPVGAPTESGLRVRVENLSVRVERGGREVARESRTVTLTVATSALALHRRVARFERRLSRGPLKPGLGRRLTARLYPVVWARGYAQHGGAPIENVLANRHVELVTNGALLGEQRAAFGHSDPAGRSALRRATARVGLTDLLAPIERRGGPWVDYLLEWTARRAPTGLPGVGGGARSPETTTTVAVNGTADRALYDFIGGRSDDELDAALADAYGARARLVASVRLVRRESKPAPDRPGKNWSLANATERTRVSVTTASAESPEAPAGWHLLWDSGRRVVRRHAVVRTWRNGDRTRRTVARWQEVVDVALGVAGDHRSGTPAPPRPVASVHERGGPFGGPNLADVEAAAVSKLVERRGGADRLARRATRRAPDTRPVMVQGERPDGLRDRTYRDLASLRDRVRNVSVSMPRGRLAGRANPAAKLAKRLRERRSELLGAPSRYDHAAERARFAARAAYLDRVLARLDERADRSETARRRLGDVVDDATGVSLGRIQRILQARRSVDAPERRQVSAAGPGSAVDLDVTGAPPYLTLAAVDHRRVPAVPPGKSVHPMAARNVNVFTVPYGDAADAVVGGIPGGRGESRVDVRTAALTLRAANRTLASASNATLRTRRNELRSSLASSLDGVERRVRSRLRRTTLGVPGLDAETVRRGVARGLARWKTTDERAMAVVNGSAARAITTALATERGGSWSAVERGRVRLATRIALYDARRNVSRPKQESVNGTLSQTRSVVRAELKRVAGTAVDDLSEYAQKRRFDEVISDVPAGLPVAPVPGYWYATINVWQVEVRGGYERFVVRAPNGTPDVPGGTTYVREAGTVRVDVDGDGQRETVGRTTPVSFRTWTTVAVAVPPNRRGVGDVNGDADERSPGWSARSDNPFHSRSPLVDHALRRDIGAGGVDARGTAGAVRG
ncbi:hypothetical protein DMJ13_16220 [halophilic archaeon]|nr:hypothetical protein DMJ13_16220 [halophilic archaeon]